MVLTPGLGKLPSEFCLLRLHSLTPTKCGFGGLQHIKDVRGGEDLRLPDSKPSQYDGETETQSYTWSPSLRIQIS